MKNLNLDKFEQDILDSVENNEWQSKGDIKMRLTELQGFLKNEKSLDTGVPCLIQQP
jgi:hypothetical protein